jgi:hypothetical protein
MLDEILEESWTYQEILNKGREKERRVWIQKYSETLLNYVHMRFPELDNFTKSHIETFKDTKAVFGCLTKLFTVQIPEEAKQAIIDASTAETAE